MYYTGCYLKMFDRQAGINFEYNSEMSKITYLDECDNYYDKDTPGIYKSIILSNGVFELDTLIYPTIMGRYHMRKTDKRYTLDGKINVFFFKADMWNQLDYEVRVKSSNNFNACLYISFK